MLRENHKRDPTFLVLPGPAFRLLVDRFVSVRRFKKMIFKIQKQNEGRTILCSSRAWSIELRPLNTTQEVIETTHKEICFVFIFLVEVQFLIDELPGFVGQEAVLVRGIKKIVGAEQLF
ncbi:hypothetical protein [Microvirga sp. G4-2]|uniref:hypothetical protein n=1 Tax=Microvirga sp. G4-2 TaxID=3434467 RepID=UPI004044ACB2